MSDAVNTVQNRYTRYALNIPLNPAASADAAAVAAARGALVALAPSQEAKVDEAYAAALGRRVRVAVLKGRQNYLCRKSIDGVDQLGGLFRTAEDAAPQLPA